MPLLLPRWTDELDEYVSVGTGEFSVPTETGDDGVDITSTYAGVYQRLGSKTDCGVDDVECFGILSGQENVI